VGKVEAFSKKVLSLRGNHSEGTWRGAPWLLGILYFKNILTDILK